MRGELAASQRAAGVLEERERLSREIHDTLAQGLTSMGILLQAADRQWDTAPDAARRHLRQATALLIAGVIAGGALFSLAAPYLETTDGRSTRQVNDWAKAWLRHVHQKTGVKRPSTSTRPPIRTTTCPV